MTLKIEKYQTKPLLVDAVRVTAENMADVAEWCKGEHVVTNEGGQLDQYVKVDVLRPISDKHTKAHVGDWILVSKQGTKIYTEKAKRIYFEPVFQKDNPNSPKIHMDKPKTKKVTRSAESGEFVSKQEAVEHPDTTVTETIVVAPTEQAVIEQVAPVPSAPTEQERLEELRTKVYGPADETTHVDHPGLECNEDCGGLES